MAAWKTKGGSEASPSSGFNKKRKFDNSNKKDSSTESANSKKRALKHARQSRRPYFESVLQAKELWNKLRVKTNTPEDNKLIMKELMSLLTGKFQRVAMQHDASRVVQAAIQFGDDDQRSIIVNELCESGSMVELAKVQYAHFVILKLIKYCYKDATKIKLIVKAFKGHFSKLAVHAVGARVVELLFSMFPAKLTTQLKLEFYGPRFTLFTDAGEMQKTSSSHPTLSSVIKSQPLGEPAALEHVLSIINKGIKKSLYSFAYFQQILREYVTSASPNDVRSLASSIADHSIHLLSTKAGARVVAECTAYGTVKDRKKILKSLKGYTRSSLMHADAYIAILRILDVVDDTVIVQKSILAELLSLPDKTDKVKVDITGTPIEDSDNKLDENRSPLLDLALSDTGSKLFLLLLAKTEVKRNKYFDPAELQILHQNPVVTQNKEEVPTSKKNSNTRRVELVQYMKEALVQLCISHSNQLLRSRCGSKVIREIFEAYPNEDLISSIANCCGEDTNNKSPSSELSILEDPIGQMTIKNLILFECEKQSDADSNELSLAHVLYEKYKGKLLEKIAGSNRGAFVLAAMIAAVPEVSEEVSSNMKKVQKTIDEGSKSNAGYHALMKAIDGQAKK
mmetsp:Transcript_35671/g.42601  ORF Transcript_35671/g.42601 Transcript_35671/m.42601 type:complete len:624 (+) Transcript_35671:60-1931(+)